MGSIQKRTSFAPASVSNPSRLAALVNTGVLTNAIDESFERLTRLAARTIGAPVSLVSLVENERQFFKSAFGLPEPWLSRRETPLSHSFCKHVVATGKPLIIDDANVHPLVKDNMAIRDLKVIAYAGMPLTLTNGQTIGSFCVIDHHPRQWQEYEINLLSDIACSVMAEIELRMLMAAKEELLDIIFHDLKNPLGAILLNSQMMKRMPQVADDALRKIANTIRGASERMNHIITDVSELNHIERGDFVLQGEDWDAGEILNDAVTKVRPWSDQRRIKVRPTIVAAGIAHCDRTRIVQALANLILMSIRRSSEGQLIEVRLTKEKDCLQFEIRDSGPPFTTEDITHFFDRFVQTPALQSKGEKLAVCLANEIIKVNGGSVMICPADGESNFVRIKLPT
jgi:signal transduction histidine kinase